MPTARAKREMIRRVTIKKDERQEEYTDEAIKFGYDE